MAQKTRKNTTIDDLAIIVKRGFDGVDKKFEDVDKRFDIIESGMEEIKSKLDQVAYRFEVQELDRRLKRVEAKLGMKLS